MLRLHACGRVLLLVMVVRLLLLWLLVAVVAQATWA
jgi:hypothetical protein